MYMKTAKWLSVFVVIALLMGIAMAAEKPVDPASPDGILLMQAQALFGTLPDKMPGGETDTKANVTRGEKLYFESAISANGAQSCNSCHPIDSNGAGADNRKTGLGALGDIGGRNDPPTFNAGFQISQFWDGRAATLAEQAKGPVLNPVEMAMPSEQAVLDVLAETGDYPDPFKEAFPEAEEPLTYDNFADAVAAFERTLISTARFDDYVAGDINALSEPERVGLKSFIDLSCVQCHTGNTIGGKMYQKMGVYHPYTNTEDIGREEVTGNPNDKYVFKVHMLRNATLTAPYFHDGEVGTLGEAIDQMAYLQLDMKLQHEQIDRIVRFVVSLADDKITQQNPVNDKEANKGWAVPDQAALVALEGEAQYGFQLVTESSLHPALAEYVGNELACFSCHQDEGTKQFSLPWIGVSQAYPQYRGREDREATLEERINGCFERSMNGTALPIDSREMKAMPSMWQVSSMPSLARRWKSWRRTTPT